MSFYTNGTSGLPHAGSFLKADAPRRLFSIFGPTFKWKYFTEAWNSLWNWIWMFLIGLLRGIRLPRTKKRNSFRSRFAVMWPLFIGKRLLEFVMNGFVFPFEATAKPPKYYLFFRRLVVSAEHRRLWEGRVGPKEWLLESEAILGALWDRGVVRVCVWPNIHRRKPELRF